VGDRHSISIFGLAVLTALGITVLDRSANAQTYSFTTLQPPSSNVANAAEGIDNAGIVVGIYNTGATVHGYIDTGGSFTNVDYPGASGTVAGAINNAGVIVGLYSFPSSTGPSGFIFNGGLYQTLNFPGAPYTIVQGINDNSNTAVGSYYGATLSSTHGFIESGGNFVSLDYPGATSGMSLTGTNNNGLMVGYYRDGTGSHGFTYQGGVFQPVNDPNALNNGYPYYGTLAYGINQAGQIVGNYIDTNGSSHGFIKTGSTYSTLDDPNATGGTYVYGINDSGTIVGQYFAGGKSYGFIAAPSGSPPPPAPTPGLITWTGHGDGTSWGQGTNWDLGRAPVAGDTVNLLGSASVNYANTPGQFQLLTVDGDTTRHQNATLRVSAGNLSSVSEIIGDLGSGILSQTGGMNSVATNLGNGLFLGNRAGGQGEYDLSGGTLTAGSELIGVAGSGVFKQTGGTNSASVAITIGNSQGTFNTYGAYTMTGGTLTAISMQVGPNSTFAISGGLATVTNQLSNAGLVDIRGDRTKLTVGSYMQFGTFARLSILNGAALDPASITINDGVFGGTGTVTGDVTVNGAMVVPGNPLSLHGSFSQTGGTIAFDIIPDGHGSFQTDQLIFDKGAALSIDNAQIEFDFTNTADAISFLKDGLFNLDNFFGVSNGDSFASDFDLASIFQHDDFLLNQPGLPITSIDFASGSIGVPEPSSLLVWLPSIGLLAGLARRTQRKPG
jgi:hypothetical protein